MKKLFTLLLLSVMAVAGAWAEVGDVTTNVNIDFSNPIVTSGSSPKNSIAGTVGTMKWDNQWTVTPSIVDGILRFGNFTGSVKLEGDAPRSKDVVTISFDLAFGKLNSKNVGFTLKDTDGGVILQQQFDAYNGDFDDKNPLGLDWAYMFHGNNTVLQERCVYFTIVLDYSNNTIKTHTECYMSGTSKPVTKHDFSATLPSSNPIGFFELYGNINNVDRYSTLDNLKITTTEGDYSAATANYTVQYMCDETPIKASVTRSGSVGDFISLTASDKDSFFNAGNTEKYIYVSDDASTTTIASDGSSVVTVNFRQASTYNYTVKTSQNTTIVNGSSLEGESVNYPYGRYINVDGTLYEAAKQGSNPWWGKSFILSTDNQIETVNYTATSINNVVYFSETEDIEGATKISGSNADIRCSMRAGGFYEGEFTTLTPGKYKLTTSVWGNAGKTITFKAGDVTILEQPTLGYIQDVTSAEFTITVPTAISISGGDNSKMTDFIYIVKTADIDVLTLGTNGYSTFAPAANCTISGDAFAYYGTVEGESVVMNKIDEEAVIPAGAGIILKGAQAGDEVTVTYTADAATATLTGNALVGVTAETAAFNAGQNYVLASNGTQTAFIQMAAGKTVASMVGKAYLNVPSGAKMLSIIFGDEETTAADEVTVAKAAAGKLVNLAGQAVGAGFKGIVIDENGNKYMK